MAGKVEVLRKRQVAQALAEKTGAKLKMALAIVEFIFDEIAGSLVKGIKVNLKDFGIFAKRQTKSRTGRNPITGESIKIKASVKPRFTPSKTLKEAVAGRAKYPAHVDASAMACGCAPAAKKAAPARKAPARKAAKKTAKRR
jgi:DNA-binding protein HU-beta